MKLRDLPDKVLPRTTWKKLEKRRFCASWQISCCRIVIAAPEPGVSFHSDLACPFGPGSFFAGLLLLHPGDHDGFKLPVTATKYFGSFRRSAELEPGFRLRHGVYCRLVSNPENAEEDRDTIGSTAHSAIT